MHYSSKFIMLSSNVCVTAFMILCACVCGDLCNVNSAQGLLVCVVVIGVTL